MEHIDAFADPPSGHRGLPGLRPEPAGAGGGQDPCRSSRHSNSRRRAGSPLRSRAQPQYSSNEILDNLGHKFFGTVSRGLAQVGGKGLQPVRPAERLYSGRGRRRRFHRRPAIWRRLAEHQECRRSRELLAGPFDRLGRGLEGARTMMLIYNLPATETIYNRFRRIAARPT